MQRYIVRRVLTSIPVLFGISILVFIAISLAPGDPLVSMIDPEIAVNNEVLDAKRTQLGLDRPLPVRYFIWLGEMAQGNMGYSFASKRPVTEEIQARLLNTAQLMVTATTLAIVLGISLGILSALRRYTVLDYILTFFGLAWVSIPSFFFALGLIYLVAVRLDLLPTSGMVTPGQPYNLWDNLQHLIMPALALGLGRTAVIMRYARSSMLEVLGLDYMTTARAKGLSERVVMVRHGFRNALLPVVTIIALTLPSLFGGTVIIETVFAWPGMGLLFIQSVSQRDYPLVMALALFTASLVLLANLLADIAYAFVDPRIRYG